MQIRVGYDLAYPCPQPTPMLVMLNVHHSRASDLVRPAPRRHHACGPVRRTATRSATGAAASSRRGPDRLTADAVVTDAACPIVVDPLARATAGRAAPGRDAGVSARQPLLRDRPAVRHRLATFRRRPDRLGPGPGHLRFRAPPHPSATDARPTHRLRGLPGSRRRVSRLRPSRGHVLPLPEYSGALLHRLSRRHWRAAAVRPMDFAAWFEAYLDDGWHTFDPRNNTPRIGRILIARGRDAGGRRADYELRPVHARELQGVDGLRQADAPDFDEQMRELSCGTRPGSRSEFAPRGDGCGDSRCLR